MSTCANTDYNYYIRFNGLIFFTEVLPEAFGCKEATVKVLVCKA